LCRQLSQAFGRSLQTDNLFPSISILDRFLAKKKIAIDKLNLVGLGSFYIACKFEETYYPSIDQLLRLVLEAGEKEDVLRIERIILNELHFPLGVPTSIIFLKRFAKAAHAASVIG
jgi:G2/mitotic-specific cyclin 1/2